VSLAVAKQVSSNLCNYYIIYTLLSFHILLVAMVIAANSPLSTVYKHCICCGLGGLVLP